MTRQKYPFTGETVSRYRVFFRDHLWLAGMIAALALSLRLFMPVGFMPVISDGQLRVSICNGSGPVEMMIDLPGAERQGDSGQAQSSCAFADLSVPALGTVDPFLLADLIAFILAVGLTIAIPIGARSADRLRPPLRGPPASL